MRAALRHGAGLHACSSIRIDCTVRKTACICEAFARNAQPRASRLRGSLAHVLVTRSSAAASAAAAVEPPLLLTHKNVEAFLERQALGPHAQLVALDLALDAPGAVKSIVFVSRGGLPVVVVLGGADRVDARKLARALGVPRNGLALASPETVIKATGYAIGTVPPLGHRTPLRTIVDAAVAHCAIVIGGSGDAQLKLEIGVPELLRATGANVADVVVGGATIARAPPRSSSSGGSDGPNPGASDGDSAAAAVVLALPTPAAPPRDGGGNGAAARCCCWRPPELARDAVVFVDDAAGVERMAREVLSLPPPPPVVVGGRAFDGDGGDDARALPVVGIDCEWRPFARGAPPTPVALLQLALRDRVFLVDMLALCGGGADGDSDFSQQPLLAPLTPGGAALGAFLAELCASPALVKLGFQLNNDLQRLRDSWPRLPCFEPIAAAAAAVLAGRRASSPTLKGQPLAMHVDVLLLARALLPGRTALPARASLSQLCEAVLGAPLDKSHQRSDWGARPLSGAQLAYAAADARVLVALFDALAAARGDVVVRCALLATLSNGLDELPPFFAP